MEPATLYSACIKHLGKDFYLMDIETISDTLERNLSVSLNKEQLSMLAAMTVLKVTDTPWIDYSTFENIVWALNGYIPNLNTMVIPPSYYTAYGVLIMKAVEKDKEYTDDVRGFITAILLNEGFVVAPSPLEFCQDKLDTFIEDKELQNKVKEAWAGMKGKDNSNFVLNTEDPINCQLSKLLTVDTYLARKETILREELNK
jgi:hypothetical protein